jgi:hypothetical protein
MIEVFVLGVVVAVVSRTVAQEEVFRWLRNAVSHSWFRYLVSCQYCFSFWAATATVLVAQNYVTLDDFVVEVLVLVAIANGLMITYELATVKIKVQRTLDKFNRGQIETQKALLEGTKLNNAYSALQLEQNQIQMEGIRMLKAQADEHNAKVAVERTKNEVPKSLGGAN